MVQKGRALNDQGKYEEAINAFDEAIKINPKLAEAWNEKGEVLGKWDAKLKQILHSLRPESESIVSSFTSE